MDVYENFKILKEKARTDRTLRNELLDASGRPNALTEFCKAAREAGAELYPMDIIAAGEDAYTNMKRSTNGGGENSPMLGTWNNYFSMFLDELKKM